MAGGQGGGGGGNGGYLYNGSNGADGTDGSGGGGGGAGGGMGGNGGSEGATAGGMGGTGGTASGINGKDGGAGASNSLQFTYGGGGGGGGGYNGNGKGVSVLINAGSLTGGNGGDGGASEAFAGGGGAGGYGAVVTGSGTSQNGGTIMGGTGGDGGVGGYDSGQTANGGGGAGGTGAIFTGEGAAITNNGTIAGGMGGSGDNFSTEGSGGIGELFEGSFNSDNVAGGSISGGKGGASGQANHFGDPAGAGGAGLEGSNGVITNAGKITGGDGGDATPTFSNFSSVPGSAAAGIVGNDLNIGNSGHITGGNAGLSNSFNFNSFGATGADGISSNNLTLDNSGQIAGGSGGAGGMRGGNGGVGIAGAAMAIVNSGTISGGDGGKAMNSGSEGGAQGDAIDFTGSTSTLTFANTTSGLSGYISVASGAIVDFVQPTNSSLASAITGSGEVQKTGGGTLTLSGASTYSGGTVLTSGTLELAIPDSVTSGAVTMGAVGTGPITFDGQTSSPATLELDAAAQPASGATFGTTLASFGLGNTLDLSGFTFVPGLTNATVTGNTLAVTNGLSTEDFTLSNGAAAYMASDGSNGILVQAVPCFVTGTLIRTVRGDVAVEALRVGDLAVTASGERRPIRWIGNRTVDGTACRGDDHASDAIWPVRVAAHAFGAERPSADLWLSPSHSVCLDVLGEFLVPIYALVNGATVARVPVDAVTYWHVELDSHDILLANGLPAESYLDMGGHRAFFGEAQGTPAATPTMAHTAVDFCRPFRDGGTLVAVVRDQMLAIARRLGWRQLREADVHLEIDGVRVPPIRLAVEEAAEATFTIPADAGSVRLVSTLTRPADNGGTDPRRLGIAVYALATAQGIGPYHPVDLDAPDLSDHFHEGERAEGRHYRWTNGVVTLPRRLWAGASGFTSLRLAYEPETQRDWVLPQAARTPTQEVPAAA